MKYRIIDLGPDDDYTKANMGHLFVGGALEYDQRHEVLAPDEYHSLMNVKMVFLPSVSKLDRPYRWKIPTKGGYTNFREVMVVKHDDD